MQDLWDSWIVFRMYAGSVYIVCVEPAEWIQGLDCICRVCRVCSLCRSSAVFCREGLQSTHRNLNQETPQSFNGSLSTHLARVELGVVDEAGFKGHQGDHLKVHEGVVTKPILRIKSSQFWSLSQRQRSSIEFSTGQLSNCSSHFTMVGLAL